MVGKYPVITLYNSIRLKAAYIATRNMMDIVIAQCEQWSDYGKE